ncbi:MAG: peptide chain release factor N(5)-glutamine methyltransferase [Acidobacteriota bacterium]
MTVRAALTDAVDRLVHGGVADARLTAEVLLADALGKDRVYLFAHPEDEIAEEPARRYRRSLGERLSGTPTQYITGRQEFYGRSFKVTPDVLIPRPETEHQVETILRRQPDARHIVDIGCGSGAIGVTVALERPEASVTLTDISTAALRIAQENAGVLNARVDFACCDLGAALATAAFDVVVSNPPYIPVHALDGLPREVRDHEPHVALIGAGAGVEIYRRLIADAERILRPGGLLSVELGYQDLDTVQPMFGRAWRFVEVSQDLAGWPRVLSGFFHPEGMPL